RRVPAPDPYVGGLSRRPPLDGLPGPRRGPRARGARGEGARRSGPRRGGRRPPLRRQRPARSLGGRRGRSPAQARPVGGPRRLAPRPRGRRRGAMSGRTLRGAYRIGGELRRVDLRLDGAVLQGTVDGEAVSVEVAA